MNLHESLKGKKIFITGALGFIGSHLAHRLGEEGARLHLGIRPGQGVQQVDGRPPVPEGAALHDADVRDGPCLEAILRRVEPDLVFNLASLTDVRRDPALEQDCRDINYLGALHVADASLKAGVKRLIHFGTCEEYGNQAAPFHEEAAPCPVSPYSRAKAEATAALMERFHEQGLPVVILRPFLTYGPGQAGRRFLAQALEAALSNQALAMTPGEQTREFNHVDDLVAGIMKAAQRPGLEGEIINLACGEEHTLLAVARMIFGLASSSAAPDPGALPYREGEAMRFFGSTEKCRRLLDHAPQRSLEQGMEALVRWAQAARKGK